MHCYIRACNNGPSSVIRGAGFGMWLTKLTKFANWLSGSTWRWMAWGHQQHASRLPNSGALAMTWHASWRLIDIYQCGYRHAGRGVRSTTLLRRMSLSLNVSEAITMPAETVSVYIRLSTRRIESMSVPCLARHIGQLQMRNRGSNREHWSVSCMRRIAIDRSYTTNIRQINAT